jgi:hypothetical protein
MSFSHNLPAMPTARHQFKLHAPGRVESFHTAMMQSSQQIVIQQITPASPAY